MSELRRRYCIFGCDALVAYGVPLHRFPNPEIRPDLFAAWIAAVGSKVSETDRTKIFKNKRICDHHFDPTFKTTGGRLICSAIPTVNLNRVQQTVSTFVETDHSYCRPRREFGHAGPMIDVTNLPESSVQTKYLPGSSRSGPSSGSTCLASSEKYHARTPMSKFDAGVQQTVSTFVETDHSYCRPRREFGHAGPMIDVTNLPESSVQTKYLPGSSRSGPSSGSTCLASSEKYHARTPMSKFDAGKTFEYLQKKAETQCAKNTRQVQNEVRRLRQKLKTYKLRIKQLKNKSANRDFEKLSRNMTESAKLFTRMQCIEGRKKKKGHRFTHEEKILSLSIFKKSPKAYTTKCLQKVVKGCKNCKSKLLGNSDDEMYKYIRAREYSENKKWLCYPSDCLVSCFQEIQETTVAFLNSDCHKKNIKERIKTFIDLFTDFSFLNCELHREKVKQCFVDTTIHIIIYSWCRSVDKILEGKITYEGEDVIKKAAQIYYNKQKTNKY